VTLQLATITLMLISELDDEDFDEDFDDEFKFVPG
jgi:hypothetical protein